MKNVRLKKARANYTRVLRTSDLDALGIKHKGQDLVFNQGNNFTIEMSNQLSDSLVERFPNDFVVSDTDGTDEVPPVEEPMTSLAQSTAGSDEETPEVSVSAGGDQEGQLASKRSKTR